MTASVVVQFVWFGIVPVGLYGVSTDFLSEELFSASVFDKLRKINSGELPFSFGALLCTQIEGIDA